MVRVRVDVLGPFRLIVDGDEVTVTRPQVRSVLALLATSSDPVSTDELIEMLWPTRLPNDPSASLRTILSRTRDVLGKANPALTGDGHRYSLSSATDVDAFTDAVRSPRVASTGEVAVLEDALSLWRGMAFDGLADCAHFVAVSRWVETLRSQAQRDLADLYERDHRLADAVAVSAIVLEGNPLDEQAATLSARCLARLGRKAEAISLLHSTRSLLRDRGLEVSSSFAETELEILQGSIELERPRGLTESPFAVSREIVGRDDELAMLLDEAMQKTTIVEGEAGLGKSSLIGEFRDRFATSDRPCVFAATSPAPERPMEIFGRLIEQLLALGEVPSPEHRGAVAMLAPGHIETADRPSSREGLMSSMVDFLASSCERSGTAIVIDDAHLLDVVSARALRQLIATNRCRMVIAARPGRRLDLIGDVSPQSFRILDLSPLTAAECTALVNKELSAAPAGLAADLHARSGGNPLFLRMLINLENDEIDRDGPLPSIVLLAVKERLETLSDVGRRLLQAASVFRPAVRTSWLQQLVDDVYRGLDEAVHAGLLVETPTPGTFTFVHALIADAAYQMLSAGERAALHDRAASTLETAGEQPMVVFPHCREAAALDGWRAVDFAERVAVQHLDSFDWDGALKAADWGLGFLADFDPGTFGSSHGLRVARARAQLALGVRGSHLELIDGAMQAREACDDATLAVATIEICNSGPVALTGIDLDTVTELVNSTLAADITDEQRIVLSAAAARSFAYSKHGALGRQLYAEAFARYEDCSRSVQEFILRNSEAGLADPNDFELRQRATFLMGAAADRNPELRWLARWFEFRDAIVSADGRRLAFAMQDIRTLSTQSERRYAFVVLGQTFDMAMQQFWAESAFSLIHGDFDAAEVAAEKALEAGLEQLAIRGDGFGDGWVTSSYGLLLLAIRHAQGRLAELVEVVETGAPLVPAWRVAIVIANFAAENIDRVREELDALSADRFAALVRDPTWTAAMTLLAEPVSALMDESAASELYAQLEPYADRMSFSGLCTFGPIHSALGTLARATGRDEQAAEHERRADEMVSRLRADSRWAFSPS